MDGKIPSDWALSYMDGMRLPSTLSASRPEWSRSADLTAPDSGSVWAEFGIRPEPVWGLGDRGITIGPEGSVRILMASLLETSLASASVGEKTSAWAPRAKDRGSNTGSIDLSGSVFASIATGERSCSRRSTCCSQRQSNSTCSGSGPGARGTKLGLITTGMGTTTERVGSMLIFKSDDSWLNEPELGLRLMLLKKAKASCFFLKQNRFYLRYVNSSDGSCGMHIHKCVYWYCSN